jgi:hypothetical protein
MGDEWKTQSQAGIADSLGWSKAQKEDMKAQEAMLARNKDITYLLQDILQETKFTASRLSKTNQSGPSFHVHKISRWSANDWALDMIGETLVEMQETLETSSIARHSKSPLETSLDNIRESSVTFNEKTMRWHDEQTNLMVKGSDPRVQAAKLKPAPSALEGSAEMVTEKKMGLGVLAGFLEEISTGMKLVVHKLYNADKTSAENKMEGKIADKKDAKNEKKQTSILGGMWDSIKEKGKKSWLAENWGKILLGLTFLFAPLKWIKKLWDWVKVAWDFTKKHPLVAAILALTAYFAGGAFLKAIGLLLLRKTGAGLLKLKDLGKTFLQKRGVGMAGHLTDAQKKMTSARMASKGQLVSQRLGRAAGKTKVVAGRAVEGVKAAGSKVGMKMGSMAQSTKGIFGSIVEKFGKAGKWIMKLGSKLIMPLVTTPVGWAILAGLAIGGLVYVFWDEIKAGLKAALGMMTAAIDKVKSMFSGLDIMAGLKSFLPGWLVDMIGPSKAEAAEDEPVKPKTPEVAKQGFFESDKAFSERVKKTQPESQSLASTSAYTSPTQGQGMGSDDFIDIPGSKVEKVLPIWKEAVKAKKESEALDKAGKFNTPEAEAAREKSRKLFREANELAREGGVAISDKTATVIPTPPRSGFKTKIPQVGVPEKKEPTEGEPSKWLPFGHDKSAFKKQTSFGDRFKNLAKFLWGDKKADGKEATPATGADAKSVELAVKTWVKNRKGRGRKSADREMYQYIQGLIGNQEEARLALLEKKLKSLDTEKVGGSSRWFKRSGFEKEKDAWVVTTPGIRATKDTKGRKAVMHRKGMDKSSSIARAQSGEEGAMEVAKERFPGIKFTARQNPNDQMETIQPANPNQQGATLTAGQQQTANLSGGSAGGNVGINTTTVNNTTLGESTMVVGQQRPVGNPKMVNLT